MKNHKHVKKQKLSLKKLETFAQQVVAADDLWKMVDVQKVTSKAKPDLNHVTVSK